ncbi:tetratricopeptide repeat protein [Sutterella sp.]|uniref:tetratricopeptide repeat protein n=1 Tax=Sutterella sp. TaxID=1981025 RepID=UPI0026DEFA72|nr:tetratricopeptide repeat protein [Sutterella sp.]MDO5530712.1 tetratricopeptide repeat protein [Sutterella sp.]
MPKGKLILATLPLLLTAALASAHPAMSHVDRTLFELIAAGIAEHRGDTEFAYAARMDAAEKTSNADIAREAWEAGVKSHDPERALDAAKLWLRLDPKAESAHHTLLADAVERGDAKAIREAISRMEKALAPGEKNPGDWLDGLLGMIVKSQKPGDGLRGFMETVSPYVDKYAARSDIQIGYAQLLGRTGSGPEACRRAVDAQKRAADDRDLLGRAADVCWPVNQAASRDMVNDYLARHKDDPYALLISARIEFRLGRREAALDAIDRAMKSKIEDNRIPYNAGQIASDIGDPVRTEKFYLRYVEMLREESPDINLTHLDVWMRMGTAALMTGAPERAVKYFSELKRGPFAAQARIREAFALTDLKRPDEALKVLREGREAQPLDAPGLYTAEAKLLLELGRGDEALRVVSEATKAHPSEPEVLYEGAMIEEHLGKTEDAEKHLQALITVSPNHVEGLNALGYLWADKNKNLKEARELLERAYKAEPINPFILDSMGWLCWREGRPRAAAEFVNASIHRLWDSEVAAHLIEILASSGRSSEAVPTLNELVRRGDTDLARELAERFGLPLPAEAQQTKAPAAGAKK